MKGPILNFIQGPLCEMTWKISIIRTVQLSMSGKRFYSSFYELVHIVEATKPNGCGFEVFYDPHLYLLHINGLYDLISDIVLLYNFLFFSSVPLNYSAHIGWSFNFFTISFIHISHLTKFWVRNRILFRNSN